MVDQTLSGGELDILIKVSSTRSSYGFRRVGHRDLRFGYSKHWFRVGQDRGMEKVAIKGMCSGM